jgi:hypothetical protein
MFRHIIVFSVAICAMRCVTRQFQCDVPNHICSLSVSPLSQGPVCFVWQTEVIPRKMFHSRLQNKSFQQMQPIICLYCICYFSPYVFRAFTGPSSGVSWAACLCYHLVHVVLLSVRASADGQTTALHEPNGSINKQPRTPLMMGQ